MANEMVATWRVVHPFMFFFNASTCEVIYFVCFILNIPINNLLSFCFILFQENTIKSPLGDNNSSNITSLEGKESTFPVNKPLIKLEPSTKMELPIKTEPMDVKPVKLVQPQKPLPIQLPRIKPKPPPVVIVSSQV